MTTRILVIDDEPAVAEVVKAYGEKEGFEVECAADGESGLALFFKKKFDVAVVDWMLPGISGPEIVKEIRAKSAVSIIMISARDDESDIVIGLELGADDYIRKPFGPRELMARLKACVRRNESLDKDDAEIKLGDLKFSFGQRTVFKAGKRVELTPNEFRIFQSLYENRDRVVSREILMEKTLGHYDYLSDRTLDTHIKNLRHKLENDPKNPVYIETSREIGFKLKASKK